MPRAACAALALLALVLLAPPGAAQRDDGPCPAQVDASANADGTVTLTWARVDGAQTYRIDRAAGGGSFDRGYATAGPEETSFVDHSTRPGITYRYAVAAGEGSCEPVHVTAISFSAGVMTALGVALAAFLGYAAVRAAA